MNKNELHLRAHEGETARTARVLRDDELDFVSGGFRLEIGGLPCELTVKLENCMISG